MQVPNLFDEKSKRILHVQCDLCKKERIIHIIIVIFRQSMCRHCIITLAHNANIQPDELLPSDDPRELWKEMGILTLTKETTIFGQINELQKRQKD